MIPTFASPGVITPGQFGPTSVAPLCLIYFLAIIMSFTGIPSVIAMITLIPASAASMIASAAKAGGTKMMETSAPVFSTASFTELKTGLPKCSLPPFAGVTPPTTLVPYSII
jgi:hypothetical protein